MTKPGPELSAALSLLVAVAVNTASVALEGEWRWLTRTFGRRAWVVHSALIFLPWAWCLVALRRIRPGPPMPAPLPAAGAFTEVVSYALVLFGFGTVGPAAAVNGDIFGLQRRNRKRGRLLGRIRDPIYLGYAGILAGQAFRRGRPSLLLIAVEALLLLKAEARVEDWAAGRAAARL